MNSTDDRSSDCASVERLLGRPLTAAERRLSDLAGAWLNAPPGPEKEVAGEVLDAVSPTARGHLQIMIDRFATLTAQVAATVARRFALGQCPNCGSERVRAYVHTTVEGWTHGCEACHRSFAGRVW